MGTCSLLVSSAWLKIGGLFDGGRKWPQHDVSYATGDSVIRWNFGATIIVALCASLAASGPALAQSSPGYSMTRMMTFEMDTGGKKQMEMKIETTGTHVRISMDGPAFAASGGGVYQIHDIVAKTALMILPGMKSATLIDMSDAAQNARATIKAELKGEPSFLIEDRGAGEPVLGWATHRYHIKSETTTIYSLGSVSCQAKEVRESDAWTTTEFEPPAGYYEMLSSVGGTAGASNTEYEVLKRKKMNGFVVKEIGTTTSLSGAAVPAEIKGTMELTAFSKAGIESSRFAVPSDYSFRDLRIVMAGIDPSIVAQAQSAAGENAIKKRCGEGVK